MTTDPPDEGLGIVAVDEEELESVYHDGDELNLLKKRRAKCTFCRFIHPPFSGSFQQRIRSIGIHEY